jgi:hypothetical protein
MKREQGRGWEDVASLHPAPFTQLDERPVEGSQMWTILMLKFSIRYLYTSLLATCALVTCDLPRSGLTPCLCGWIVTRLFQSLIGIHTEQPPPPEIQYHIRRVRGVIHPIENPTGSPVAYGGRPQRDRGLPTEGNHTVGTPLTAYSAGLTAITS